MYLRRGMGNAATDAGMVQAGAGIATPLVAATSAGAIGSALGISTAVAVPVIGAAIAGVALLATYLIENSGCGVTCVETSDWANQAAALLQKNLDAYFALPVPRSQSNQAAALQTYENIWNGLVANCSQAGTGTAGENCISDRQAGACKWRALAPQYPGQPAAGDCWNWDLAYRVPIAQDPNVADDATALAANPDATVESAMSSLSGGSLLVLALAALAIWAVAS